MSKLSNNAVRWAAILLPALAAGAAGCNDDAGGFRESRDEQAGPKHASMDRTGFLLPGVAAETLKPFRTFHRHIKEGGQLKGYIDWSGKKIVSFGRSRQVGRRGADALKARHAAKVIALRNALALSAGVRIGIDGRVDGVRNGRVTLQGLLRDFNIAKSYSETKGGGTYWTAEAHVPMFGIESLASRFYESQLRSHRALVGGLRRAKWSQPTDPAETAGDVLVIDARGTGFRPSMFPLFLSRDNRILIDMETMSRNVCIGHGPCAYATTNLKFDRLQTLPVSPARWSRRKPRRHAVRASRTGRGKNVLVLTNEEALKMLASGHVARLVRDGCVLVIVDAPSADAEIRRP